MGLKVVVLGQYTHSYKLFLENLYEIKLVLWLPTASVVYGVWRNRQTILTNFGIKLIKKCTGHTKTNLACPVTSRMNKVTFSPNFNLS